MAVRIERKSWWVDFRFNRVRYRKRSPDNSRAGALAYEAVLRQRLARGEQITPGSGEPEKEQLFSQFAEKWFDEYVVPNNKHSEQRSKRYVLNATLIPFFGKMPVGKITAYHTEQLKGELLKRGVSNKTIKNYLTVLNKCLHTAYEWLQLEGAPPKIKWPKCNPMRTDFLSPDECQLLLNSTDGLIREMILTALRTGMRQGEIKGLQWSSVDWENRSVTVRHSRDDRMRMLVAPKSNRERHIPLDVDVYEMLFRRKRETSHVFLDADKEPLDYHRMERRLTKACAAAGLRRIGWHTLRHTFASQLVAKGVPMTAVQQLMGHSNITTTMRYAHLAPSTLRAAVDMLNPKNLTNADYGQPVVNKWIAAQREEAVLKSAVPKSL
jgi:integrase